MNNNIDFEVGIIGGGPAGTTLASYLAKAGVSCIVFEKEHFPRPHVGESLVPAVNRVLNEIGIIDDIEKAGFPKKYGAAWTADNSKVYQHDWDDIPEDYKVGIRFDEREMYGNRNYTFHVDRAKFDHMLMKHASKLGANIVEGARVRKTKFEEGQHPVITVKEDSGEEKNYTVRLVVDASGRHTLLGNQLKIKTKDPVFNQFAIHTWFDNYDRGEGKEKDFIFIYFFPIPNTWMWQIPITETVTSIGVVTQKEFFANSKAEREQFFWDCIAKFPDIHEKLKAADQVNPLKEEGDYSYAMDRFVGDGWALVGDAARFVDPIFSSGVSVALNSARFLSHDIIAGLSNGVKNRAFKRTDLLSYEKILHNGTKNWYKFITLYYKLNVLFTKYVHSPKYRLDILKLLSGDVYDEESPEALNEMQKFVDSIEANKNHILYPLLGTISVEAPKPIDSESKPQRSAS